MALKDKDEKVEPENSRNHYVTRENLHLRFWDKLRPAYYAGVRLFRTEWRGLSCKRAMRLLENIVV